ncbi:TetR/AcrR family transcriptional regulator [Streptomyces malaysiensis]|uniref:TetR/AcrR family transcriptional regulator n=1 Tax=Streptomyces malaysiensis TaxID=92644 RepID=UPI001AD8CF9B|nr:TetR/AcrR family transcriptional regulator [Streptomyces malaysiensis]
MERNLAALTKAAKHVFATSGVNAPAKEITDLAGVGVGTLYRHFPRRSDLIVAVVQQELDDCVAAADTLSATLEPTEAFAAWIERFTELVATKQGLAEALHSADPAYDGLPARLLATLEPALATLLEAGVRNEVIRPDVSAHEILLTVALLCQPVPGQARKVNDRLVSLFIEGLGRTGSLVRDERSRDYARSITARATGRT